jgi:hypothetical protein
MLAPSFADSIREATVARRPVTGESAKDTVKPSRRESRMIRLKFVPRMLRSATSAFTRVFDTLWRCAADPGSTVAGPGSAEQRESAAPRPGHEGSFLIDSPTNSYKI